MNISKKFNKKSFRFDRGQAALNINPDIGFVCWLSNAYKLPECRFYRLVHNKHTTAELPTSVFAYRIGVHMTGVNPLTSIFSLAGSIRNEGGMLLKV